MADEETQGQQDTLWWSFDDFADPSLPSVSFDEPLVWPETLVWDDPPDDAIGAPAEPLPDPAAEANGHAGLGGGPEPPGVQAEDSAGEAVLPLERVIDWGDPADPAASAYDVDATVQHADPLGALGGGAGWAAAEAGPPTVIRPSDDSIWAQAPAAADTMVVSTTPAAPTVYPETEAGPVGKRRRFDVRPGNAAVIALISLASLVLLGMFLSVRGRDDLKTDSTQTRSPSDGIEVTGTLNTVPLITSDSGPPPTINISDLVPTDDTATDAASSTATTAARSSTATTAATTATTARPTQPTTATTAAAPETTAPATTSPPTTDTTATTIKRTTTSFTIVIPTAPPHSTPTFPSGVSIPSQN